MDDFRYHDTDSVRENQYYDVKQLKDLEDYFDFRIQERSKIVDYLNNKYGILKQGGSNNAQT